MEKKEFEFYQAPKMGVVEVKMMNRIMVGSGGNGGAENMGGEGMGEEEE